MRRLDFITHPTRWLSHPFSAVYLHLIHEMRLFFKRLVGKALRLSVPSSWTFDPSTARANHCPRYPSPDTVKLNSTLNFCRRFAMPRWVEMLSMDTLTLVVGPDQSLVLGHVTSPAEAKLILSCSGYRFISNQWTTKKQYCTAWTGETSSIPLFMYFSPVTLIGIRI